MPTSEIQLLFDLGLIVMAAAAFAFIGKVIRVPSLVGYIIAGIFIGPILQWVQIDHSLELISELGIALLLFLVGLELSLKKIRDLGKVGLILGVFQITLTGASAFILATALGVAPIASIFIAGTLTY